MDDATQYPKLTEEEIALELESRRSGATYHPCGWGIVDREGRSFNDVVSTDEGWVKRCADELNDGDGSPFRRPYRIVRIYWREED